MSEIKRFNYLDAARGYAILMVIAVHTSQLFGDLPGAAQSYLSQGARGVQLFFVVSALTLSLSWFQRDDGVAAFYIRRIFRIGPMLWLAIVFFVAVEGFGPRSYAPDGIGARQIGMTALLLHGLMPDAITSVVPGSWSVADEAIFYAIFPVFAPFLVRCRWPTFTAVTALAVVGGAHLSRLCIYLADANFSEPYSNLAGIYFDLWFVRQLPCFIFGVLLFRLSRELDVPSPRTARIIGLCAFALLIALPLAQGSKVFMLGLQTTFGIAFALVVYAMMNWQPPALVNPAIGWVGKVSFSAYFVHFGLLSLFPTPTRLFGSPLTDWIAMFAVYTVATLAISTLTYTLIERPMIKLGANLIEGWRSVRSPAAASEERLTAAARL